jgi:hypothetical protein
MRRRRTATSRGSTVAEALVARVAGSGLRLARDTSAALALAEAELEALRAGPQADGADEVVADGVAFARAWSVSGGRGRPARVAVEVAWGEHRVSLATGVLR